MTTTNNLTKDLLELSGEIDKLTLEQVSDLVKILKEKYNISENVGFAPAQETEAKVEEKVGNVTIKIESLLEGANKIQAYKAISDVAKAENNDINIIQAKKIAEEKGILLSNISNNKAKEIKELLESKGVKIQIS